MYLTQMNKTVTFPNHLMPSFNNRSLDIRKQLTAENKLKSFPFPCFLVINSKDFSGIELYWFVSPSDSKTADRMEFRFFRTTFRILAIPRIHVAYNLSKRFWISGMIRYYPCDLACHGSFVFYILLASWWWRGSRVLYLLIYTFEM